ncbi:unnamed protein product [Phytophthora lilii]|uniref:Unnamed protein product n=1 Tax=Phytophthora lilii TaxID=2077276 RepID=A0A9W6XCM9_9STRA|nr:unnamed protein product [Phytophthora lilii]
MLKLAANRVNGSCNRHQRLLMRIRDPATEHLKRPPSSCYDMIADFPVLTSAQVVANYCLPDGHLPHVVLRLNDLLDDFSADCTIADAYKRTHSLRLVQYVAAREDPDEMNSFYRRWLFNKTTEMAAANGDLETLRWLVESYLPDAFLTKAVAERTSVRARVAV